MKEKEEDEENKIRKFAQNRQTDKQTNKQRFQLQRPLLSPVDRRGERANIQLKMHIIIILISGHFSEGLLQFFSDCLVSLLLGHKFVF